MEFPLLHCIFIALPLVFSLGTKEKSWSLSSYSFTPSVYVHPYNSLTSSRQNSPSSFSLSLINRFPTPSSPWPFAGLIPVCPHLFCTGELRTGPSTADVLKRETSLPLICWRYFPKFGPLLLAPGQLIPHQDLQILSCKAFFHEDAMRMVPDSFW